MNEFLIALLGDGYFSRWGDDCPELYDELIRLYSHSAFKIENHGLENSRTGSALARVSTNYQKDGAVRPNVAAGDPTALVIESFAYSQFWDGPEGLTEYRDLLRRIFEEVARTTSSKILFCIAPPPIRERFLENAPEFVNTSKSTRARFADTVRMYLDEARSIAEDEGWPHVDVGEDVDKFVALGESPRRFVNNNDNVYPSRRGYKVAASAIVRGLDNNRFVNEVIHK